MRILTGGVLILLFASNGVVAAEVPKVTFSTVETDPASPATLHGKDNVYVHFHYVSDIPIRVWVAPYSHGEPATAITSGSPPYPAGEGEGFG